MLQKLSNHTESNFVSTKALTDSASGKLRARTMDGIHYNDLGIRILAKEIKKSLYSSANRTSRRLSTLCALTDCTNTQRRASQSTYAESENDFEADDELLNDEVFDEVFNDTFDHCDRPPQLHVGADNPDAADHQIVIDDDPGTPGTESFDWLH